MIPLRRCRPSRNSLYGIPLTILLLASGLALAQTHSPDSPPSPAADPTPATENSSPTEQADKIQRGVAEISTKKAADGPFGHLLAAVPYDPDHDIRTEIGILVKDLHRVREFIAARRATQRQTPLGAQFYAPGAQKQALGLDLLAEMSRLVDLASPAVKGEPSPVPGAVVSFTVADGAALQGLLAVAPGFIARLRATGADQRPSWVAQIENDTLRIPFGDYSIVGRVGEDGWLRLALSETSLVEPVARVPEIFFSHHMVPWVEKCDGLLFVRGNGDAALALAAIVDQPLLSEVLFDMRMLAIGWQFKSADTFALRLMLDNPTFDHLRLKVRRQDLANHLAGLWDSDATRMLSFSVPPVLLASLWPRLEAQLAELGHRIAPEVKAGIDALEGRLGIAYFGSPGDWAAGAVFEDEEAARALLPALRAWGAAVGERAELELSQLPVRERVADHEVFHARSDIATEGLRFAAIGNTVVAVTQKQRLVTLLNLARTGSAERHLITRHMSPEIRALVEHPAMMVGYMVIGDTGELFQYAAIVLGLLKDGWRAMLAGDPRFELVSQVLFRAPTLITLEGFSWAMLYDLAFSADFTGSVLVLQLLTSEL